MSLRSPSSQLSCPVLLLPGGIRSHCAQKILLNLILTLMGDINKGMYFLPKHSQPLGTWQCYSHSFCSLWNEFQAAVLNLDTVSNSFDILEGNLSLLIYLFIFAVGNENNPLMYDYKLSGLHLKTFLYLEIKRKISKYTEWFIQHAYSLPF